LNFAFETKTMTDLDRKFRLVRVLWRPIYNASSKMARSNATDCYFLNDLQFRRIEESIDTFDQHVSKKKKAIYQASRYSCSRAIDRNVCLIFSCHCIRLTLCLKSHI